MSDSTVRSFTGEIWKNVPTPHETKKCDYMISNFGRLKSIQKITKTERLLKGSYLTAGYHQLNFKLVGDKRYGVYVHRFIGEHFVPKERPDQNLILHLDQNLKNNHFENLKWVNQEELTKILIERGHYKIENRKLGANVKMTEAKVRLLKQRIKAGKTKKKILAKTFGITTMQLNRIERGENWGHVKIDEDE